MANEELGIKVGGQVISMIRYADNKAVVAKVNGQRQPGHTGVWHGDRDVHETFQTETRPETQRSETRPRPRR